jgi:hypothetical protein
MLFDLRGRRRRTVQVTYLLLALLMGGGLIFFGIGGNTSGGLFDAFKGGSGGGGSSLFEKRVKTAERRVRANPRDVAAWETLARLRVQLATSTGFDRNTGAYTGDGVRQLRGAAVAWQRYLALDPRKPDANLAIQMVQAYDGLNRLDDSVRAMEIVTEARPTYALFAQLAALAYRAGQTRKGDLARGKALSLAPKSQREALKAQLDLAKAQAPGAPSGAPSG